MVELSVPNVNVLAFWRGLSRFQAALAGMCLLLLVVMVGSLTTGAVPLSFRQVIQALIHPQVGHGLDNPLAQAIVWDIRLPRILLALLVGAVLAVCGAALQGIFRNPLADPGLIGVSGGAALAAGTVIVFAGAVISPIILPLAAFLGALFATVLVVKVGQVHASTSVATVLLAGIALNAIAVAGIGLLSFLADDQALRDLTFWTLGSVGKAGWQDIAAALPLMLATLVYIPRQGLALNALLIGEAEAGHLGVRVEQLKRRILIAATLGVGAAVSLSGIIGFIGLIVPHLLRLMMGSDHRFLLPASALLGGTLLIVADTVSRVCVAPAELPVGILTALLGGPFFLWMIIQTRDRLARP